jgi:hypothetical protein
MTNVVNKATLIEDIWRNFFDRIKSQVTSVTITTDPFTVTVQGYHNTYSDEIIDSKSNYPFIIVEDPKLGTEQFTMTKTKVNGSILIEVYTTQAQSASKFQSSILEAIETYKGDFASVGIHNVELDSTDSDMFVRGAIKVHSRSVTIKFDCNYERTRAF